MFRQFEVSILDVVEEIFTLHVLEDNIVIIRILKQINQTYNIRMLTHLEHINLSPLLVDLDWFHVLLVNSLDGHFVTCFLVAGEFNLAELAFTQVLFNIVIIKHVRIPNNVFE